ncbi:MAG: aminotransferase class I/II-fold pyridoxal phosphate-dependent enzyme [Alphaproteobacteria bacterium]|nr:aminotransferase class I/II-fold pyridoxal phosphate-dependent enzyme [Alphaproteobacteria bacterium]
MHNNILDQLTDYPFDRLRALLRNVEPPAGRPQIHMQIGEPNHAAPDFIGPVLVENMADWGRYPPPNGPDTLRAAIAEWLAKRYDLPAGMIDPARNIAVVSGTREALFMAALLTVPEQKAGAKPIVLMPNPFYQVYVGAAAMARAETVLLPAGPETGFQPDFASVDPAILERTALAYLNSPANPQGSIADLTMLEAAVELARRYDFVLAVDECYSEIYTADPPPGGLSACSKIADGSAEMSRNVLVFHSLSKRSNVPGLRSGFVAGDAHLIALLLRLRQYGGAQLPLPVMNASEALWRDETHVEQSRTLYREKFDLALEILDGVFGATRPGGAFYLWLDVGDGETAAERLWREAGVRVLPGEYLAQTDASGSNPGRSYIRAALVHDIETTRDALNRIRETLEP